MSNLRSLSTSHIQRANWFLYKLNPKGLADKISLAIRIKSLVDPQTVKNTLQILTERHSLLRSTYFEQDGNLISDIRENIELDWEEIDASSWSSEALKEQLSIHIKLPFNLEKSGVFRACLFRTSATENILLLTLHQIAGDRESLLILVDEFVTLYESTNNNIESDLIPLKTAYKNYIDQELEFLNSSAGKQA
ncbi:MAG: non-ribosomal peptide synthetase, partial [Symploca sp. SIO2D2]|nr:non-ribosomal peptide synthetase [Symploca sp. SIO2D2]